MDTTEKIETASQEYIPKWHRELDIFRRVKSLLLLEGNILDSFQYPSDGAILQLPQYLHRFFSECGYRNIVHYDPDAGFHNPDDADAVSRFAALTGTQVRNGAIAADFRRQGEHGAAATVLRAVTQSAEPTVVILDFASRYIVSPENLQQAESDSFTLLLKASLQCREVRAESGMLRNLIVLLADKANDLPAWIYLNNPAEQTVQISTPSAQERERLVRGNAFRSFFQSALYEQEIGFYNEHPEELARIQERFVALTDGFSFTELNCLRRLCKSERFSIRNMCDVIDLYRYGISENPWKKLDLDTLRKAEAIFQRRVKGQVLAVGKTLDVVKRAVTGLNGMQGAAHNRPKGVLFFAGPTGTGKTETAKTLAELLFGDESACIRFDMSEFSASHSDQRLLGAPPGYVGYETGGQLTNAVRSSPFSILLFDEIEKAHPSILDKFLQILEDGRMTDGQGNTVYFSECIIIFTSNLGVYTHGANGERLENVTPDMPYSDVRDRIRSAVAQYFKEELGRPEILNRIGENIVVFDYIRPETARAILHAQVGRIADRLLAEKKIRLTLSEEAAAALETAALSNLSNGGRGIGNIVESRLINPLARCLFDKGVFSDAAVHVERLRDDTVPESVECTVEAAE